MRSQLESWYQFGLQQFAAESHLAGIDYTDSAAVTARLIRGNTRPPLEPSGYTRMTEKMATEFLDVNQIVAHRANDGTGLSASLFRWQEDGQTRYTLSIRSTEFKDFDNGGDWARDGLGADIGLVTSGFALGQLAALEDFFTQSVLPVIGNERVYVTGYSLGGHLATVFTEMHSDQVRHAYLFNSPGRGELAAGAAPERLRAMVNYMRSALLRPDDTILASLPESLAARYRPLFLSARAAYEADPTWNPFLETDQNAYRTARYRWASLATSVLFPTKPIALPRTGLDINAESLITSIYGSALDFDVAITANSQVHASDKRKVFIEGQPIAVGSILQKFGGDFGDTHSITLLVDSLALQREFLRLDPALSQEAIEAIFAASSAQKPVAHASNGQVNSAEADSLEKALVFLRQAFDANAVEVPSDDSPGGFGNFENRGRFYEELAELPQEGTYSILDLTGKPEEEIARLAGQDDDPGRAIRYALSGLQPFAVLEGDYSESRFTDGELDLYDAAMDRGLTPQWIDARSKFLDKLIDFNSTNGALASTSIGAYFEDVRLDIILGTALGNRSVYFFADESESSVLGSSASDFLFGSSSDNPISANDGPDYVEGGAGDDTIDAGRGDDEVLGGSGADTIYGRQGADNLVGGTGADRLEGGADDDELEGGDGFDTYIYAAGDGFDTIYDADGDGEILYEGRLLAGGTRVDEFAYQDAAGTRYTLVGKGTPEQALIIDDAMYVIGFQDGDLGITLVGDEAPVDVPDNVSSRTYVSGSKIPTDAVPLPDWDEDGIADFGFPLAVYMQGSSANDTVETSSGSYWTRDGGDTLTATSGQVFMDGGADADFLNALGATLPSTVVGGSGNDYIVGGASADVICGDNRAASASIGTATSATVDGFVFNLGSIRLASSPENLSEVLAGWGALANYRNDLIQETFRGDVVYAEVAADIRAAGWEFGTLDNFLTYVIGSNPAFDDYIDAQDGDDVVTGGSGADTILGGDGNDNLTGDYGVSGIRYASLRAQFGDLAAVFGQPGSDFLDGGGGNDTISDIDGGDDTLVGGPGDDVLLSAEDESFNAGTAYNYIDGGDGADTITATGLHDEFNVVVAGGGADNITVGGNVVVDGGSGNDTYRYELNTHPSIARIRDVDGDDTLLSFAFLDLTLAPSSGGPPPMGLLGAPFPPPPAPASPKEIFADAVWADVSGEDLTIIGVTRQGDRLVFEAPLGVGGVTLVFEDWFQSASSRIEHIGSPFATALTADEFETWGSKQTGTDAGEFFDGGENTDRILAAGGDDVVFAGGGDDWIAGGMGADSLDGSDGNDSYYYAIGHGDDVIFDSSGFDELIFGPGIALEDVSVTHFPSSIKLEIGDGSVEIVEDGNGDSPAIDRMTFADGTSLSYAELVASAPLEGSDAQDDIAGSSAADILEGGAGNDVLRGFAGSDVYRFALGDGVDSISDTPADGETNTVAFGTGITPDMLTLGTGPLVIRVGAGGDEIRLENVDPNDVFGSHDVEIFEFEDGTRLTYADLVGRGFDLAGTAGDDVLLGTNTADRLLGTSGDDILYGSLGSDTYSYDLGGGADLILEADDPGAIDVVKFGPGITSPALTLSRFGNDLRIETGPLGDDLTVADWFSAAPGIERLEFADGTAWLASDIAAHVVDLPGASAPPADIGGADVPAPVTLPAPAAKAHGAGPSLRVTPEAAVVEALTAEEQVVANGVMKPGSSADVGQNERSTAVAEALFMDAEPSLDTVGLVDFQVLEDALVTLRSGETRERITQDAAPLGTQPTREVASSQLGVTPWDVADALLQMHLSRPDAVEDGVPPYLFGKNGVFTGIGLDHAQALIGNPNFGSEAHSLSQFKGLREGFAHLT